MKPITFHRSILGQMAIVAALFIGWGVYTFAIRQIVQNADIVPADPIDMTVSEVRAILSDYTVREKYQAGAAAALAHNPTLAAVKRRNPDFVWYALVGNKTLGTARAPRFYALMKLDRLSRDMADIADPAMCAQTQKPVQAPTGRGYMSYSYCEKVVYYEFYGIARPLPLKPATATDAYQHWLWLYSQNFLKIAGLSFLLIVLVLVWNITRIRRVANRVRGLPLDAIDEPLPERSLPREVVPLVQAVNTLVAARNEAQANRRFFLSAAAHEMRTPLTVLRTRLELLDESVVKDKLVGDVKRMTALVNQLLTLVSMEDRSESPHGNVDLVSSSRKVLEERAPLAAERGVRLRLEAAVRQVQVEGNPDMVEVAIANLLDNAISFSPRDGQVVVTVTADRSVVVRDHGPGIPEDKRAALFEPFVRFTSGRGGFGLGLAIVKAVMQAHGGSVLADNAHDGGAYFILHFAHEQQDDS